MKNDLASLRWRKALPSPVKEGKAELDFCFDYGASNNGRGTVQANRSTNNPAMLCHSRQCAEPPKVGLQEFDPLAPDSMAKASVLICRAMLSMGVGVLNLCGPTRARLAENIETHVEHVH